jgi:hypothetical protein
MANRFVPTARCAGNPEAMSKGTEIKDPPPTMTFMVPANNPPRKRRIAIVKSIIFYIRPIIPFKFLLIHTEMKVNVLQLQTFIISPLKTIMRKPMNPSFTRLAMLFFSSSGLFGDEEKFSWCSVYAFYGTALFSLNHFSVWWQAIR